MRLHLPALGCVYFDMHWDTASASTIQPVSSVLISYVYFDVSDSDHSRSVIYFV